MFAARRDRPPPPEERRKPPPVAGLVRFRSAFHNTVYDVLRSRPQWQETESDLDWDVYWADVHSAREIYDSRVRLDEGQRILHFPNHYELTRKDLLVKNVKRMKKALRRDDQATEAAKFDFVPTSFLLPADYALFFEEFRKDPGSVWIMKPIGRAQGKGIFLFNKLSQISEWKKSYKSGAQRGDTPLYIVQRYVSNPYLVGGKKFDMRIYVLVTSYSPLKVYLYRDGFARFSNHRFSMNLKEIQNNFIHLTNVAIQKTSDKYEGASSLKWGLASLRLYLISRHGIDPVNALFHEIQEIIIRSLLSVQKIMINDRHCFELYGYDVLIDEELRPWLLEVNASPSVTASDQDDYDLKFAVLDDTFTILDMENRLKGTEDQVGGFDLIYDGEPVRNAATRASSFHSLLGCHNNRLRNLRRLFRSQSPKKKMSDPPSRVGSRRRERIR